MKAIVLKEQKSLPSLVEMDYSYENAVQVQMKYAALNHRDLYISQGLYPAIKTDIVLGSDGCGTYDGEEYIINPNVNWGDNEAFQSAEYSVLGMPTHGTMSEYIWVPKDRLVKKPAHLTCEQSAALPLGGLTAYRALMVQAEARASDKVLISGVGGGVAQFALQFAVALGAEVYVTSSSPEKIEKAVALGAVGGVNYREEGWHKKLQEMSGGIDVIIDGAGGDGFKNFVKIANPGARIAIYGGTRGKITEINPQLLFWRQIRIQGSTMGSDKDFAGMVTFVNKHEIIPAIDTVFSLANYEQAFKKMESGEQFGKLVLGV